MNNVACVAYGGTKFSKTGTAESHMADAARNLFSSVPSLERGEIDGVLVSTNGNSKYLAARLSEVLGLQPRHAHTIESLCSSGTNAIVSAYSYIRAGLADVMLVVGADETKGPGRVLDSDISRGRFSKPVYWASLFAASYKRRFGASAEQIASVPAKNHSNAAQNPLAMHLAECTTKQVLESKMITSDLRLYECSRSCTGASAILLASESAARRIGFSRSAWISGVGEKTVSASVCGIDDLSVLHSTVAAGRDALRMAGTSPGDVDVLEVHDAFAVCEPMALEALGISKMGGGAELCNRLHDERSRIVNPRGGIIGSGHPLGATGVAQVAEIAAQLAGLAGPRQVDGAKTGLVHNMAAASTSSTVLVMKNEL